MFQRYLLYLALDLSKIVACLLYISVVVSFYIVQHLLKMSEVRKVVTNSLILRFTVGLERDSRQVAEHLFDPPDARYDCADKFFVRGLWPITHILA